MKRIDASVEGAARSQFRADTDRYQAHMIDAAHQQLAGMIPDPGWTRWAAHLAPAATIAAIAAWLDADRPDPDTAATRIRHALIGIVDAARRSARP